MKTEDFKTRKQIDLNKLIEGRQILMINNDGRYCLGTVRGDRNNKSKKHISNDFNAKLFYILPQIKL